MSDKKITTKKIVILNINLESACWKFRNFKKKIISKLFEKIVFIVIVILFLYFASDSVEIQKNLFYLIFKFILSKLFSNTIINIFYCPEFL